MSTFEALADYVRSTGLPCEEHADEGWLATTGFGENGDWTLIVEVHDDREAAVAYSVLDVPVPEDQREAVALLLTRLNSGLVVGSFELDLDDGELRFKTDLELIDGVPSVEAMKRLVGANLVTMDHCLPVIAQVLDGADPHEAAASVAEP